MVSLDNITSSGNPAIIFEDKSLDHFELSKLATNTAAKYFTMGIRPGDKVAILSENSFAYVISVFALWRINAIPVPLNIRLKEEELRQLIEFSGVKILLKSEYFSNYLTDKASAMLHVEYEECSIEYNSTTNNDDVAVILFTSGSSGKPKGVEISNSNLYESYLNITAEYSFTSKDRFLVSLPFYHIGGFSVITRSILSGGTLIIPNSLKSNVIADSLQKYDPTVISLVPTMLKRLMEKDIQPNKNMRLAFIGGGPSDDSLVTEAINLGWPFVKVYGSTETCSMVSGVSGQILKEKPASGGKAFNNVEMKIFNDLYQEAKPLEVGEIVVKSKSVARGYFKNSELWNDKFHGEYYLTGDSGYIDKDGYLFVVSRRTDLIISGGENIDPLEIETILNDHPAVNETIVFPISNMDWGQIPIAVVSISDGEKLNEKEILDYLKNHISSYKLPRKIYIIEKLPKTDLGKIDLHTLKLKLNLD